MKLNLNSKIIGILIAVLVLTTGAAIFISNEEISKLGLNDLINKSQAILSRLEVVRQYIATQGGLKSAVQEMVKNHPTGDLNEDEKMAILKQVPIFAAMTVGKTGADLENYQFRVFSDEARRKENQATSSELEIFKRFQVDSNLHEWTNEDEDKITVYRPVYLKESQGCLVCHGNPSSSPWGNGKDILGFKMENWADGKLHGVFAITSKKAAVQAAESKANKSIFFWASGIGVLCLAIALFYLRGITQRLYAIAQALRTSGRQLATSSEEIASTSESLSSSSAEAAASLEETSASTEEMSSMIRLNAANADEANRHSAESLANAQHGKELVNQLLNSMREIAASSKRMEEIIAVIDDIAFQTNLLALNAAVESARAGEHGRGFGVVADAVRALSQKSSESAKEIAELIAASVEKIDQGSKVAEKSGQSLAEIVHSVEKLARLNSEIANASKEQSQGVQGINQAIVEIDKVTQLNAAASEKAATSSVELSGQSQKVYELVSQLFEIIEGHSRNDSDGSTEENKTKKNS